MGRSLFHDLLEEAVDGIGAVDGHRGQTAFELGSSVGFFRLEMAARERFRAPSASSSASHSFSSMLAFKDLEASTSQGSSLKSA